MTGRTIDAAHFRYLNDRVIELEGERSEAREQLELLTRLQNALAHIARERTVDDVLAATLRAAHDPLGFGRCLFFSQSDEPNAEPDAYNVGFAACNAGLDALNADLDAREKHADELKSGRRLRIRLSLDGEGRVERVESPESFEPNESFRAASAGGTIAGSPSDLCAPLVDVRGRYVLGALAYGSEPFGFLYVDDPQGERWRSWESDLVAHLAAIAAVASRNAILLADTEELALRDPLTGLPNRRALDERVCRELEFCRRHGATLVYVILDVDDFKSINDRAGHASGDAVLVRLAAALGSISRSEDIVARLAGDEFVAVLVNVEPALVHYSVARISGELQRRGLRCSIGAAVYPRDGLDAQTLAGAADRALYAAKAAGKNRFAFA